VKDLVGEDFHAVAALWARAGKDQPPHNIRVSQSELLSHKAAQRISEEIDLFEIESTDEAPQMLRHIGDVVRRLAT
jgi:hypothetical protein